ncbi:MAG: putative 4-hydroxy-4-methyl-2-oxoglutarate aldolase [Candidatus Hydrogenedens sp.]|nr:putative 4-hydroxy-4-methyl-2-oxoglutarate aldolase [Candidatus Hydrogenedens sp.]
MSKFKTADLCDHFADQVQIAEEQFLDLGGRPYFSGAIETIKAFEDNSLVREAVASNGEGKVLVIDGGGSMRRAMLGDQLAAKAVQNGWSGVIINGCIRDSADISEMDLGVKALGTHPLKTDKRGLGDKNVPVRFAGVDFVPGHYLYADEDGILVSAKPLELPEG